MSADSATLETIRATMQEHQTEFIFAQFVDLYGRPSAKLIPAAHLDALVEEGAGFAGFAAGEIGQLPSDPDIAAMPDLDSFTLVPWQPNLARFACDVTVEGEARSLPPALDLVSFRIVQEALTNAIKHAGPARALVRVTFTADCLQLEIVDTGRGPLRRRAPSDAVGHGLVGMRERLSLYGGELRIGQRSGGGYQVLANIPLAEVATP